MMLMDWIRKITDIIMPLEPPPEEEEEVKETKKADVKAEEVKAEQVKQTPQPAAQSIQAEKQTTSGGFSQGFGSGTMSFTRHGGMVSTAENGVTSMDGVRYEAYNNNTSEASVRPSLAVVKTPQLTMKIYAPDNFDQVVGIADDILEKRAAVVNYERVNDEDQLRISDFVNGVCYVTDGTVSMVSEKIFLYLPSGVESGEIARVASSMRIR